MRSFKQFNHRCHDLHVAQPRYLGNQFFRRGTMPASSKRNMPVPDVKFTKNYRDRSTDSGFQFEFFCDSGSGQWMPNWLAYHFPEKCSYSYVSSIQPYPVGVAKKVKEATSWLTAKFPQISPAGDAINSIHKEAWDSAFATAVQEAKRHFRQCSTCSKWVCAHSCFNEGAGACRSCSGSGFAGSAAGGTKSNGNQSLTCPHCGETTEPGRFCSSCGKSMTISIFCGKCGKQIESQRRYKFCPHCGDSLDYIDDLGAPDTSGAE
jgi:hypothetical protein